MSRSRSTPVGLVVASLGLGLLAMWISTPHDDTTPIVAVESTTSTIVTAIIVPDVTTFTTTTIQADTTATTTPTPATTTPATTAPATVSVEAETTITALAADLRISVGLPPVVVDDGLQEYARVWATHMATEGELSHSDIGELLEEDWAIVGENVGAGGDASVIFEELVDSPSHYAVMVDLTYTEGGVGAAVDDEGRVWVCQVLASPTLPVLPTVTLPTVTVPTLPYISLDGNHP